MMRVTLINPPMSLDALYGKFRQLASFQPPLGLATIAGYLLPHGYDVKIIDCNCYNMTLEEVVKEVVNDAPDIVGLYTISWAYPVVEKLAFALKQANPSLRLVAGGPHATFMPEQTLTDTPIDYCVLGEGEETLLDLLRHLEDNPENPDLEKIQGLAYRTADGTIAVSSDRVRVKDLDALPFPAIHLLPPLDKYRIYMLQHKRLPYMPVASTRGCPHECVFCETPSGKITRAHSPEYMMDYLGFLANKFGVKEVAFVDDTFTINEKRVFSFCDAMLKKNIDLTWYGTAQANVKNQDIFKAMKNAGCWIVAVGIESGNQRVLDLICKGTTIGRMQATCKGVLDAGLILKTFFILGNPGDTVETIDETINFARTLKAHFPVFSLMTPFPGAPLWNNADEYGSFDRSDFNKLRLASDDPVFIPFGLSKEILLSKQKEAFRKNYFNASMVMRQLASIESVGDFAKLTKAFLSYLQVQYANAGGQKKLAVQS